MDIGAYFQALLSNQIVTGLSATALLGAAMFQLRQLPDKLHQILLRSFTVKLTVDSRDTVFLWVDKWLSAQPYAKRTHMVTLRSVDQNRDFLNGDADEDNWMLTPGYGMHWFWWRGRLIVVWRNFEDAKVSDKQAIEKIEFRTIGRSQKILRDIVNDAHELVAQKNFVSIRIWRGYWAMVPGKLPRSIDTLILKQGQMERILADLEWFSQSKEWYVVRGIPYRRGYLFVGPPGTGKTSIVMAIAGHLKRPVCVLNLGSVENDNALFSAIADAPVNAMVVIEDIDCAQPATTREEKSSNEPSAPGDNNKGVSKAGLLNALDGITTPDGRILIMTTNYPERLDDALIRPGRADVHETLSHLEADDQVRMANRFYGRALFIPSKQPVSPAALQAAFMRFPDDPGRASALIGGAVCMDESLREAA